MICGWCGEPTRTDPCANCTHADIARPWLQRGQEPPTVERLDPVSIRRRLAHAKRDIKAEGGTATVAALAERLDVSERTVRRWREMTA